MFCNTFLTSWRPPGKLGGLWSSWPSSLAPCVSPPPSVRPLLFLPRTEHKFESATAAAVAAAAKNERKQAWLAE